MAKKDFVVGLTFDVSRDDLRGAGSDLVKLNKSVKEVERSAEQLEKAYKKVQEQINSIDPSRMDDVKVSQSSIDSLNQASLGLNNVNSSMIALINTAQGSNLDIAIKTNQSVINVTALDDRLGHLSGTMSAMDTKSMADGIDKASEATTSFSTGIMTLEAGVQIFFKVIHALELLADPERLRRISSIVQILSNLAAFRGASAASNKLQNMADTIDNLADSSENFSAGSFVDTLEEIERKTNILRRAFESVTNVIQFSLGTAITGVLVGGFRDVSPRFKDLTDTMMQRFNPSIRGTVAVLSDLSGSFKNVIDQTKLFAALLFKPAVPGVIGFTHELQTTGTVLAFVGTKMTESENAFVSFAGNLVQMTGFILGGMTFFVTTMLSLIGALVTALGFNLLNALDDFSRAWEKSSTATQQFEFVITNFGVALGESVGSLATWNNFVDEVKDTTVESVGAIRKSISSLVKESSILGLSAEQNQLIIKRGIEIAAATGQSLTDVTQALISGFAGSGQAALNLGVDLRSSAIAHEALHLGIDKEVDSLGEAAKVQLRFAAFLNQTTPIIGAAKIQIDSLTGSEKRLEVQQKNLTASIGGGSSIAKEMNNAWTNFLGIINTVPDSVLGIIGLMGEVAAVIMIVIGTLISFAFTYNMLAGAITLTNAVLTTNSTISAAVTSVMTVMGNAAGVTTIKVTSLNVVIMNLTRAMIGGIMPAASAFGAILVRLSGALVSATAATGRFLMSMAPLLLSVGAVIVAVLALSEAFQELSTEQGAFADGLPSTNSALAKTAQELERESSVLQGLSESWARLKIVIVQVAKLFILSVAAMVSIVGSITTELGMAINSITKFLRIGRLFGESFKINGKEIDSLKTIQQEYKKDVMGLGGQLAKTAGEITEFGASRFAQQINQVSESTGLATSKLHDMEKQIKNNINTSAGLSKDKLTEGEKEFADVAKKNLELQQNINEFGRSEVAIIKMRRDGRLKELEVLSQKLELEGNLDPARKQTLEATRLGVIRLANLKIAESEQQTITNLSKIKGPRQEKATTEKGKDTGAESKLVSILGQIKTTQIQINEFGLKDIELINLRKNARLDELKTVEKQFALEGNLGPAQAVALSLAKSQTIRLATLEITREQNKEELAAATFAESISARLESSDIRINALKSTRLALIKDEALQGIAALRAESAKLDLAGKLTPQLRRSFNQLIINDALAAKFKIADVESNSMKALAEETERMAIAGLEGNEKIDEQLRLQLQAITNKEDELKAAGLLTKEAEKLLNVQRELAGKGAKKAKKAGESKDKEEDGFDFDALADGIAGGFEQGVDFFSGAITDLSALGDKQVMALTSSFESLPEQVAQGMKNLPEILEKGINGMVDAFSTLIDKAPEMIGRILEMLPGIIDKLFAAVTKMFEALPAILSQVLDALIPMLVQIMEKLPALILTIFDSIGDMAVLMMDKIPGIIVAFAENLGPIIEAFVEGLVSNVGKIVIGFIDTFIIKGGAFKIGIAIAKAMIIDLPIGILKGLAKGLQSIFKSILSGAKIDLNMPKALEEMPKKLGNELSKVAEGVKSSSSNVFAVVDMAKTKSAKTIDQSIGDATKRAASAFKNTFKTIGGWLQKLWAALKVIWDVVVKVLQALWDVIEAIWDVVVKALQILWDAIEAIWDGVILALMGVWDALVQIFATIWEGFQKYLSFLSEIFAKVWEGFQQYFTWLQEIFGKLWTFLSEGAKKILEVIMKIPMLWIEGAKAIFDVIMKIPALWLQGATSILNVITQIPGKIGEGVTKLWGAISSIPGKFAEGASTVLSKFGEIGNAVFNQLKSAFDRLNPANVLSKMFKFEGGGKGTVEKLLNIDIPFVSFAQGGVVPGTSNIPGDNKKNDTVAALLSPGEVVVPNSILADPEIARLVQSIMEGNVKFAFGGIKRPKIKISAPKITAPKLPTANDLKNLSSADLINSVQDNLAALSKMAFGDLWGMFKDKVFDMTKNGLQKMIESTASFDTGGIVPGDGMGMLHQNEIVLPTSIVDKIMSGGDKGKSGQGQVINITANVTVNGGGDKGTGKTIVDEIFKEIRKRSANQKIMHESGLIR